LTPAQSDGLALAKRHFNQGAERLAAGAVDQAIGHFERATALAASWPDAHVALARAYIRAEARGKAEQALNLALKVDPGRAEAVHLLGALYCELDRYDEALPLLTSAAAAEPDNAQFQRDLGAVLMFFGDLPAARRTLLRAVELDPYVPEIIDTLPRLIDVNDGSPECERLLAVLESLAARVDEMPDAARLQLHFALAKAWEDRGETDLAFAELAKANAIKRSALSFDIEDAEQRLEAIAETFDRALLDRLAGGGVDSAQPVFIVGMPRSGSTLVEQIISAHSQAHGAGEVRLLPAIAETTRGRSGEIFPYWATNLNRADYRSIGQSYLDRLPPALPGQVRVTDKWLENFEHLGLIHLALPRATIIHCRRDPGDVGFSCFSLRFTQGQEYAYDLVELGRYWRAYDRLMAHWRQVLPPGRMLEVPYEAVVEDLEGWARRIVEYCGLPWEDACLRFYDSRRAVRSASAAQVREPIYRRSVGRWKPFARHLAPMFEAMGRSERVAREAD
jgi:tetratricopeptide (TPR) repeat protein